MLICPAHDDRHFDVEGLLILQKGERVALGMVGGCSKRHKVSLVVLSGQLLTVWMILKSGNDQRTTHFALTSPSHHQSGLRVIVDESCILLSACTWLLRMSIDTDSWREDAPNC